MKIISHRGFWLETPEKNTLKAFDHTVSLGYGTETDVRDLYGDLVVSHDPPTSGVVPWATVVDLFNGSGLKLAVNVKADGLSSALARSFDGKQVDWFAFDMSGPEMWRFRNARLPFYTRHSDIEPSPILYEDAKGVWLDAFNDTWFDADLILAHVHQGKEVCVVSSELHGREPEMLWQMLKPIRDIETITVCTDRPLDAKRNIFND